HHALRDRSGGRSIAETVIPECPVDGIAVAEFESYTAEDERQQHDDNGEVERWNYDGESEREGGEKADAAEDKPSLVTVPDRRDRVHDDIARLCVRRKAIEHAHTEIETIKRHIKKESGAKDHGPHRHEVEYRRHDGSLSDWSRTRIGPLGRPLSIGEPASRPAAGPARTILAITMAPPGKIIR